LLQGIPLLDLRIGHERRVADQGADAQAAVRFLDAVQARQVPDVHQAAGPLDVVFHQVDEVRAAADHLGDGIGDGLQRAGQIAGPGVGEAVHCAASITC